MNDETNDPIIDACLDEVLGGQSPPNLTARILRAWEGSGSKVMADAPRTEGRISSPTPEPSAPIKVRRPKPVGRGHREASPWLALVASLSIIGIGGAIVWIVWDATELRIQRSHQIVAPEGQPQPSPAAPNLTAEAVASKLPTPPAELQGPAMELAAAPKDSQVVETMPSSDNRDLVAEVSIPDERPAPLADNQIVLSINELIRKHWESVDITPTQPIADDEWCRRVHRKLIGREPNAQELSSFIDRRSPQKRVELVDTLLDGDTYIEEFAAHWSRTWSDILLASNDKRANRQGLEQYLRRAFGQGQSFDETTYELLTATGSGTIGDADYNGATNFLAAHADQEGVYAQATAHVSRTFMGLALECSQCHVDGTWSGNEQQQFWELNSFFRQLRVERNRDHSRVADADAEHTDGEVYYTLPNGLVKAAFPVFVDGTAIPRTPSVEKLNRRDLLARMVTRSEQFRQAMANRFWAELFGVGFTIPADNMGPHNPPSHPELLAKLGGQFAAHDYDVRALIRWIVLSEPFALSEGDVATYNQIGASLAFNCFPPPRDLSEPVLKRLQIAQQAYASVLKQSSGGATSAVIKATTVPGTVPLELTEVDKLLAAVATQASHLSKSTVYGNNILESNLSIDQKIQHMFFATLHRAPTVSEQRAVAEVLAKTKDGADRTALEYIWWALASSREAR
ncbi:MAG: DUF1549 domain-containing protein [Planctomycetaceae bacterium]|nr:DUF1549 domain-containing protein [Planctomycetales bacterium]MCB9937401.1 DUF1549 domain-containing protein [Planctomycetaceae bacterium]